LQQFYLHLFLFNINNLHNFYSAHMQNAAIAKENHFRLGLSVPSLPISGKRMKPFHFVGI